ncbi:hypothetical protein BGT96224_3884 [Blumeria graminis f. sp. tritici 96224]|uniref:Uncharacterized protein n=1 Tax=Blumeria graminis f. sp. tritici 96224 TaxID=1268274 RepID=A0A656KF95_BLUGR|nr:hypothetical protein BGT96224_3884 [Blumeria graminis f. sp. tritici 96224]
MDSTPVNGGGKQSSNPSKEFPNPKKPSGIRHPTVYDAVAAGRISVTGFITSKPLISCSRDTSRSSRTALPPEQVLFRSRKAPTRFAECDIYFSNERHDTSDLPSSDLLKALHSYSSNYYSKATADRGVDDWQSLDGSALLALGILAEELMRESVGSTGDLALAEGDGMCGVLESSSNQTSISRSEPAKKKRRLDIISDFDSD